MAAAKKVTLCKADGETNARGGAIGGTEPKTAGRLFLDIDVNYDLIGIAAFARRYLRGGKETQRADALGAFADFARIERVTLDRTELAADNAVKRGGIALDVDAFDKDAVTAHYGKFDIQRQRAVVAGDARLDPDKRQVFLNAQPLQPGDRAVNRIGRIDLARLDLDRGLKFIGIDLWQVRHRGDLANAEPLAFTNVEGHKKAVSFAREFGRDR